MANYTDNYTINYGVNDKDFERWKKAKQDFQKKDTADDKANAKIKSDNNKAANDKDLANLKSNLSVKYANVKAAYERERIALQLNKELEVKEAIATRKILESELRQYEATYRNTLSKELATWKAVKEAELMEQRKLNQQSANAPRTILKGGIGSEGYTSQLMTAQRKMLPGSEEFKQTGALIERYKTQLKSAGIETLALADKTSLFRQKQINLGADLTVLAFGIRGIVSDFKDLGSAIKTGDAGFAKIGETMGMASLQALSMTPALLALKKAIPINEFTKGAGAVGLFALATADLVNKANTVVDVVKRMREGNEGFFQAIRNALSNNTIGQFTKELFGIKSAADIVTESLNRMALASQNAVTGAQIQEMNRRRELGFGPEEVLFENQFKKQQEELKNANKVTKTGTDSTGTQSIKEEESAILKLLKALDSEVQLKELRKTIDAGYLTGKLNELHLLDTELLKEEEQIALLTKINDLRTKLFGVQPGIFFSEVGNPKLGEKDGEVVDRFHPEKKEEKSFMELWDAAFNTTSGMVSNFAGMFAFTNLMQGDFGKIIQMIQGFLSSVNSGVNFVSQILRFIPGGGIVAGVAGGMSSGMPSIGGNSPNIMNMVRNSGSQARIINNQPIIIRGSLHGQKFLKEELPAYNSNSSRDIA